MQKKTSDLILLSSSYQGTGE